VFLNLTHHQHTRSLVQPMDELFLLPRSAIAMPRAYWLDDDALSSQLMVVEPSELEFHRIQEAMTNRNSTDFDMEIVNELYGEDCLILPHRGYNLLTGEFRNKEHAKYLGSKEEIWDGEKVLAEAKFLHFSDWPFPKPWLHGSQNTRTQVQPDCKPSSTGDVDCTDRKLWNGFYLDFKRRRQVCFFNTAILELILTFL